MNNPKFTELTKVLPAEKARKIAHSNKRRQWNIGGLSAKARFETAERVQVVPNPSFKLKRTDKIFTMGSCFAREIENALSSKGIPLLLNGHGVMPERFESWNEEKQTGGGVPKGRISRGVFHKYTTHSMYFDIDRAFNGNQHEDQGLLEINGKWFDPHAAGLALTDLDTALESRARVDAGMATVAEADVVIITLGLTESWRELRHGLIMNRPPRGADLVKNADLFEFIDFGYDDIYAELVRTIEIIKDRRGPEVKFVISVSPVPSSTFSDRDIVEASVGSKSTLRTAAESVSRKFENVDYFPSYEMVTLSPRGLAWKEDAVHVQRDMVRLVTQTFIDHYFDAPEPAV